MTARPRGRPPLEWLTWEETVSLPVGTAVRLNNGWQNGGWLGRVKLTSPTLIRLRRQTGAIWDVDRQHFARARPVPSLFEPGDPVLRVGRTPQQWRGGVIRTDRRAGLWMVEVETLAGTEWVHEDDLVHADILSVPEQSRPGPVRQSSADEDLTAQAWRDGRDAS